MITSIQKLIQLKYKKFHILKPNMIQILKIGMMKERKNSIELGKEYNNSAGNQIHHANSHWKKVQVISYTKTINTYNTEMHKYLIQEKTITRW